MAKEKKEWRQYETIEKYGRSWTRFIAPSGATVWRDDSTGKFWRNSIPKEKVLLGFESKKRRGNIGQPSKPIIHKKKKRNPDNSQNAAAQKPVKKKKKRQKNHNSGSAKPASQSVSKPKRVPNRAKGIWTVGGGGHVSTRGMHSTRWSGDY